MSAVKVAEFLHNRAKNSNMSMTELSRRAHVSRQTLYRLFNADVAEAKLSTMVNVCSALKVDPADVMNIYFGRNIVTAETINTIH